jgi:hypothetical protein
MVSMSIFVKRSDGRGTLQIDVESSTLISDAKKLIEQMGGPPAEAQQLVFSGRVLESGTLTENLVTKEATLVLHCSSPSAPEITACETTLPVRTASSYSATDYKAAEYKATEYKATEYKANAYTAPSYTATTYTATNYKAPEYKVGS